MNTIEESDKSDYLVARQLLKDNINKIQIYEGCQNKACTNQNDLWPDCHYADNKYYAKEEKYFRGQYLMDVAIFERLNSRKKLVGVIEIWHPDRIKTMDAIDLYRLFMPISVNRCNIIAVSAEDVLDYREKPNEKIWRLKNQLNYQTCIACFLKLISGDLSIGESNDK